MPVSALRAGPRIGPPCLYHQRALGRCLLVYCLVGDGEVVLRRWLAGERGAQGGQGLRGHGRGSIAQRISSIVQGEGLCQGLLGHEFMPIETGQGT